MSYPIHPDDIEMPRTGTWADDFNTYEEACRYYGVDTPAQVAAEEAYYFALECVALQDDMEARGPVFNTWRSDYPASEWAFMADLDDDLPF